MSKELREAAEKALKDLRVAEDSYGGMKRTADRLEKALRAPQAEAGEGDEGMKEAARLLDNICRGMSEADLNDADKWLLKYAPHLSAPIHGKPTAPAEPVCAVCGEPKHEHWPDDDMGKLAHPFTPKEGQ